jgi:hypothetical protein
MAKTIDKITIAIAFAFAVGIVAIRPALADDHHGGNARHAARPNNRGRGHHESANPDYYYAPPVNYYSAPEPEYYYAPQPEYVGPPPPSQGVNLFFGF